MVLLYNSYPKAGAPRVGAAVPDLLRSPRGRARRSCEQALFRREGMTFGDAEGVERLITIRATPSFFRVAPSAPMSRARLRRRRRRSRPEPEGASSAMRFWLRHLGGRDNVVGEKVRLNGQPFDVVGVLPAEFSFLQNDIDLFTPAAFAPADKGDDRRHSNNWQMIGLMAPDATVSQGAGAGRCGQSPARRTGAAVQADSEGRELPHRHGQSARRSRSRHQGLAVSAVGRRRSSCSSSAASISRT